MNFAKGLTIIQEQEFTWAEKIMQYLRNHQAKVNTYLPLKNKQTQFEAKLDGIQNLMAGKMQATREITRKKKKQKEAVADFYQTLCALTLAYLRDKSDLSMAGNFKVSKRTIMRLADGEVLP